MSHARPFANPKNRSTRVVFLCQSGVDMGELCLKGCFLPRNTQSSRRTTEHEGKFLCLRASPDEIYIRECLSAWFPEGSRTQMKCDSPWDTSSRLNVGLRGDEKANWINKLTNVLSNELEGGEKQTTWRHRRKSHCGDVRYNPSGYNCQNHSLLLNATLEWQIYFSAFTICAQRDKPIDVTKMST